MEFLSNPDIYISLISLTAMEIVLGIDNLVFIAIICGRLPEHLQPKARTIGLTLALLFRIALLMVASWIASLNTELFFIFGTSISARDLILLLGGLFLIYKSTKEIFHKFESNESDELKQPSSFSSVIGQIILIDIVFSLDSIITAIGLVDEFSIMVAAVIISLIIMLVFSGKISAFIDSHPSLKILALSFLMMIGILLVAEGFEVHFPKGYVYFAMAFSLFVETVNINYRAKIKRRHKV